MKQSRLNFCFKRPDGAYLKLIIGNGNTHHTCATTLVLIERRGGLPCSAEEEEAVFGRRQGSEPGHKQSGGLFVPSERLGPLAPST